MSRYYATIQGNRGEATRQGTKASGIRASAQSWEGSIIVRLWDDSEGNIMVTLNVAEHSSAFGSRSLWTGKLNEIVNATRLEVM